MDKNIPIDQNMIDYIFYHTEKLHPIQKKILKYKKVKINGISQKTLIKVRAQ